MIKRIFSVTLLLIVICVSVTGCTLRFANVSELIRPPRPYGENGELQKAFEAAIGNNMILKPPVNGDYLSAFVTENIDGDEEDEALVFYAGNSYEAVKMAVFDSVDGEWTYSAEATGAGNDVYSVDIKDLNGDDENEILISWNLLDNKRNKILSVYDFSGSDKTLTELAAEMYTLKKLADVDGDGHLDIFLAHLDTSSEKQTSTAKLLQMAGNAVYMSDKKSLDGNISGYDSIKTDSKKSDALPTIYIDANKGEMQMITEVLYWNSSSESLSVPLLDSETMSNTVSWRSVRIASMDIDGDGIIEIPSQESFDSGKSVYASADGAELSAPFYVTRWSKIIGNNLSTVRESFVNYSEECIFYIPDEWNGKFSVIENSDTDKWDFYDTDKFGDKVIFSVIFTSAEGWEKNSGELYENYSVLLEKDDKRLLVSIPGDNPMSVDSDFLKNCFEYYE